MDSQIWLVLGLQLSGFELISGGNKPFNLKLFQIKETPWKTIELKSYTVDEPNHGYLKI